MYYIFMPRPRGYTWHCASLVSLSLSLLERSPLFLTPCRPFCFVDDFTRVGHARKISQTMVGLSSKEDSIAISSLDRGERNLHTSVASQPFIFKDYSSSYDRQRSKLDDLAPKHTSGRQILFRICSIRDLYYI